jgi:hypothetical protein
MKRGAREAKHSLPSSAEAKNDEAKTQLRRMPLWFDAYLIKHMDNFTFLPHCSVVCFIIVHF